MPTNGKRADTAAGHGTDKHISVISRCKMPILYNKSIKPYRRQEYE
jgi:hypothetical protein